VILRAFFLSCIFLATLFANKVIYSSYFDLPQRVITGQIFTVTLKTLSTVKDYQEIQYKFAKNKSIKLLNTTPYRTVEGKFFYDKFYLQALQKTTKLPDIKAKLIAPQEYNTTIIPGKSLKVITLNPPKDFCNIIANEFVLTRYKTTKYDNKNNIIIFSATAKNSDIEALHFNNVTKQGIESVSPSYIDNGKITYYIVVDKKLETFSFRYFNLPQNRFVRIDISIIVDDDSVTTQSDLKPKNQSHEKIKMYIALATALAGFAFIIIRKKYIYLLLVFIPLGYILYLAAPQQEICVKAGSKIHLLPVDNGTIFKITQQQRTFLKEGDAKNYTKIRLDNEKIGWIKNADTCSN